jgi:predicted GNAT family N-acyltransferase
LSLFEHDHWNWRNKADSVEDGRHLLVGVEYEDEWQGIMAVARLPRSGRLGGGWVIYVDFLEVAPWNLKLLANAFRFKGVGTALLVDAVMLSIEEGFEGAIGLHSLPQAEPFYNRCGMTRVGEDPDYHGLPYYEFTATRAAAWLASIGESR